MTQQLENIINIICQSFPEADSNYTFKYPNISRSRNADICRKMEIPEQLVIYAHMGRGRNEYMAYTEHGISIRTEASLIIFSYKVFGVNISWEELQQVDYSIDKKQFYFYLKDCNYRHGAFDCVGKFVDVSVCESIAEALTRIAQLFKDDEDILNEYCNQFDKAIEEDNYDKAIEIAESIIEKDSSNKNGRKYYGYAFKGRALLGKYYSLKEQLQDKDDKSWILNLQEKGNECLDIAIANLKDDNKYYKIENPFEEVVKNFFSNRNAFQDETQEFVSVLYLYRGHSEPNPEKGRIFSIAAMSSEEFYQEALETYKERTTEYLELVNSHLNTESQWISERRKDDESDKNWDEHLRQLKEEAEKHSFVNLIKSAKASGFIYVVKDEHHLKGCFDSSGIIRNVFTMNDFPKELCFPIGHPLPNTLYRPHPMDETLYIPYEGSEESLFLDKIREFCRVVQCLGAIRISYKSLKGSTVTSEEAQSSAADMNADILGHSGNINVNSEDSESKEASSNNCVDLVQTFSPTKTPYVPDDVVWYNSEISWQQLAKQRIEGDLLHYELCISSSEASSITNTQKTKVNAAYKNLVASVNGFYNTDFNQNLSNSEERKWEILVDFQSKETRDNEAHS